MLVQPKCFSFYHAICSFRYAGARFWNSLDLRFKDADSLSDFKVSLRKWQEAIVNEIYAFCVCAVEQLNMEF